MIRYGYQHENQFGAPTGAIHERGYNATDTIAEEGTLMQIRVEK